MKFEIDPRIERAIRDDERQQIVRELSEALRRQPRHPARRVLDLMAHGPMERARWFSAVARIIESKLPAELRTLKS